MVAIANPAGNIPALNGSLPCEGTKVFPYILDFTGGKNAYAIDLSQQAQQKQFTTLQTVYVDNSANTAALQIICGTTGQIITCPALSQGYFAILQPMPPQFQVQTTGNLILTIQLLNFYIPPCVWSTPVTNAQGLVEIDIPALDAIITGGLLQVATHPATLTGPTDISGTIAVGGTRQALLATNAARKRWMIQNPPTATEVLQFSYVNNTNGLITLAPGMIWDEANESVSGDAIFIVAATAGHAFTGYAW
jgi:hypothetical protein